MPDGNVVIHLPGAGQGDDVAHRTEEGSHKTATTKVCSSCKQLRQTSEFSRNPDTKDKLRSQCRSCIRLYRQSTAVNVPKVQEKQCRRCRKVKSAHHFTRKRSCSDGLRSWCKACIRDGSRSQRRSQLCQGLRATSSFTEVRGPLDMHVHDTPWIPLPSARTGLSHRLTTRVDGSVTTTDDTGGTASSSSGALQREQPETGDRQQIVRDRSYMNSGTACMIWNPKPLGVDYVGDVQGAPISYCSLILCGDCLLSWQNTNSMKRCTSCKTIKDTSQFSKKAACTDGLRGECKECLRIKRKFNGVRRGGRNQGRQREQRAVAGSRRSPTSSRPDHATSGMVPAVTPSVPYQCPVMELPQLSPCENIITRSAGASPTDRESTPDLGSEDNRPPSQTRWPPCGPPSCHLSEHGGLTESPTPTFCLSLSVHGPDEVHGVGLGDHQGMKDARVAPTDASGPECDCPPPQGKALSCSSTVSSDPTEEVAWAGTEMNGCHGLSSGESPGSGSGWTDDVMIQMMKETASEMLSPCPSHDMGFNDLTSPGLGSHLGPDYSIPYLKDSSPTFQPNAPLGGGLNYWGPGYVPLMGPLYPGGVPCNVQPFIWTAWLPMPRPPFFSFSPLGMYPIAPPALSASETCHEVGGHQCPTTSEALVNNEGLDRTSTGCWSSPTAVVQEPAHSHGSPVVGTSSPGGSAGMQRGPDLFDLEEVLVNNMDPHRLAPLSFSSSPAVSDVDMEPLEGLIAGSWGSLDLLGLECGSPEALSYRGVDDDDLVDHMFDQNSLDNFWWVSDQSS